MTAETPPETSQLAVVVGHVDHGKSTLIGRLLYDTGSLPDHLMEEIRQVSEELGHEVQFAYLLDALEEERSQNITIDTTRAFLKTGGRDYVIVDAPGHAEFLRNMVTGASAAHAAILMVDASRGIEQQTRRHGYLLSFLGVSQVIVIVNKMDLVDYSQAAFNALAGEVGVMLEELGIQADVILPVAAALGDNIGTKSEALAWHSGPTVLEALHRLQMPRPELELPLRFSIQDRYRIGGRDIAVGIVHSGRLTAGATVTRLPQNEPARVESVEVWGEERESAEAGECVGVVLADGAAAARGDVLTGDPQPAVTVEFLAEVFWMAAEPLARGESVRIQCSTRESGCQLLRIERKLDPSSLVPIEGDDGHLRETEVATARFRTDEPAVLETFQFLPEMGRFVLVRDGGVVAGGIVRETR